MKIVGNTGFPHCFEADVRKKKFRSKSRINDPFCRRGDPRRYANRSCARHQRDQNVSNDSSHGWLTQGYFVTDSYMNMSTYKREEAWSPRRFMQWQLDGPRNLATSFAEWQVTVSRKRTGGRLYYYVHTHKTIHPASTKISWL